MHAMHGSMDNQTDHVRLSSNTRYQLASEPVDERWIGADPKGRYRFKDPNNKLESLDESRARWGG